MSTKVIALYLPQYHCIPENDEFWGKGFTDWVSVKKAEPLFEGHIQPRVPLKENYYDLSHKESVMWQARLARKYGIYGFAVYHYWFNNDKNLLTKPAEIMRDSEDLGVKYFFDWDNCLWKRSWSNVSGNDWSPLADKDKKDVDKKEKILIPYILGREPDWENHYNYVRKHFLSPNYEKRNNKPVFALTSYSSEILEMCEYWNELAKKDGFDGICFIYRYRPYHGMPKTALHYNYQPHDSGWANKSICMRVINKVIRSLNIQPKMGLKYYDYDKIWKKLISYAERHPDKTYIHGAFVDYDDTPRRGKMRAIILRGGTPEKFGKYFKRIFDISNEQGKPYLFLTAWNEWGEGAYLEPDIHNGTKYLEAIKNVLG